MHSSCVRPLRLAARSLARGVLCGVLAWGLGCAQNYQERAEFEADRSGAHDRCVLQARSACAGAADPDACVADKASSCVGRVDSAPDPADEKYLPSGVEDSFPGPEGDPDFDY